MNPWVIFGGVAAAAGLLWLTGSEAEAAVPEDPFMPTQKDGSSEVEMSQQNTYDQIRSGNVPAFLRDWKPVRVSANGTTGTFFVSPDYLGIGTGSDYLRTPMYPATAQRLADELGFILPTKKMVEAIESQAIALPFHAHAPTPTMGRNSTAMWRLQNDEIRADLAGREDAFAEGGDLGGDGAGGEGGAGSAVGRDGVVAFGVGTGDGDVEVGCVGGQGGLHGEDELGEVDELVGAEVEDGDAECPEEGADLRGAEVEEAEVAGEGGDGDELEGRAEGDFGVGGRDGDVEEPGRR